jgi:hypothetical protein
MQAMAEEEAISMDVSWHPPPEQPHPREELRRTNVPTVFKKDNGKMSVPKDQGTPRSPPPTKPEAEDKLLKESISLLKGEAAPGRKMSLDWPLLRIVRRTRTEQTPF